MFGTQSVTFWYPTFFPQFRILVRPPTSPPQSRTLLRTPNPYLPLSLTLKGREGWREGRERAPLKFSHRSTCLHTTCRTISYVVLDRHVSTQCVHFETYSCACSHTKRRVSAHFMSYEVISMRNVKHMTTMLVTNVTLTITLTLSNIGSV